MNNLAIAPLASATPRRPAPSITPITDAVGAEVRDIDLATVTNAEFDLIKAAWHQYSALLFRHQSLDDDGLLAFSRRFGALDSAPVMENGRSAVEGKPQIYVISNVLDDGGEPIGSLGSGEAEWHTDMSYLTCPPDASMLLALEIPDVGGNTSLAGMNEALRCLPMALRREIEHRAIKHDGTYNSGGMLRQGVRQDDNPQTCEGTAHPAICVHPQSGIETLYLGRRRNAFVVGLPLDESEALLDELWAHATRPEFQYEHAWQVGDLLLWDNRCTLHKRGRFDSGARRVMHRTQISGSCRPSGHPARIA